MTRSIRLVLVGMASFLMGLEAQERLLVYAGAASKPVVEEIARNFEKTTGIGVDLVFGGSGYVLAQMQLNRKGDVYFPGSSDFMELAKKKNLIRTETEKRAAYLVSALNVSKGNPQKIQGLRDLLKPGLKVAIAHPEHVCVGTYAVEILEKSLSAQEVTLFRKNLRTYTESCEKTATVVALGSVDVVIGWSVFQHWDPTRIETIPLPPSEIQRVGYLPLAVTRLSKQPERAQRFVDYVVSPEGQAVFGRFHYFASAEEAFRWIGASKPVGGQYTLPGHWSKP